MGQRVLVILSPGFPGNEQDTSCLPAFQQFALSLQRSDPSLHIRIIAFQYPFVSSSYFWNGIEVQALGGGNRGKLFALQTWLRAYRALKKISRKQKDLAILSLWITDCALVGNHFAKKNHMMHLIWIIGQDARATNRHVSRIRPDAGQLVAMSDFLQEEFEKNHGLKPAFVIPNGINENTFPPFNQGDRPIDIFGAGSLIPLKNYRLFIGIVAEVRKSIPTVKAAIAGDGGERQELLELIRSMGLQDHVVLLGQQTHPEVLRHMSNSRVFLHTSHYEGNSTVLAEALYSGCFAASTRPLSRQEVPNLFVSEDQSELVNHILKRLSAKKEHQRIVFNTMDQSAKRMLDLLFQ